MKPSRPHLPAASLLLAVILPCHGGLGQTLTPLSNSPENHFESKISPDGETVLYRTGPGKIGRVSTLNGADVPLVVSLQNDLFDFLWAPNSLDVYYLQGNSVRSVARTGGLALTLATIQGASIRLWCVDPDGSMIYGTRRDGGLSHIFSLDTSGQALPVDILSSPNILDEVRIDSGSSTLLYRSGSGLPFTAREYFRSNLNGGNVTPLLSTFTGESAEWSDQGQTFVLSSQTPTLPPTSALGRVVGSSGVIEFLTGADASARRSSVGADGEWILCEAVDPRGGVSPAVMPAAGGGLVMLVNGQPLMFNGGAVTGGLSMDAESQFVAFSASRTDLPGTEQVYLAGLDREIRIEPRVEVGQLFTLELPLELDELGAVAFSVGADSVNPLTVPGVLGAFELLSGPGQFAVVLAGQGDGSGPLSVQAAVPNRPALIGVDIYFQGLRIPAVGQGSFTHWGWFTIF